MPLLGWRRSTWRPSGRAAGSDWARAAWLLCALVVWVSPALAQIQSQTPSNTKDADFLAALRELPEAGFADKEAIVDRLSAGGHSSVRPVLAALLEDRLF